MSHAYVTSSAQLVAEWIQPALSAHSGQLPDELRPMPTPQLCNPSARVARHDVPGIQRIHPRAHLSPRHTCSLRRVLFLHHLHAGSEQTQKGGCGHQSSITLPADPCSEGGICHRDWRVGGGEIYCDQRKGKTICPTASKKKNPTTYSVLGGAMN